ncbi:hypothetical protein PLICRDRAFT_698889 [Plicaturopsis crispa FD-325 SS-3]|nr:hypothetical protein PLICRDRAFT_698889 [Plicaturopsis crispa FD-325 SS-3]
MSDKENAVLCLRVASENCTAALSSLASRNLGLHEPRQDAAPALAVIQRDLQSILSLIYASTTKLALSLKPSSPTYAASLTPLKDVTAQTASLLHCTGLFQPEVHGATLIKEVNIAATDIIEAIRALVQTFLSHTQTLEHRYAGGSGQAGDDYMIKTGTVHDLIDKVRGRNGISKDNLEAVRKKWTEDRASLDDGFREVAEMVEDAEGDDEEDAMIEDDGWDEIGLGSGMKMDKDELERTKSVHSLLRLTTLLHKRILLDILSSTTPPSSNILFDSLLSQSAALLVASDDLVSTLYTPQNPASIRAELTSFITTVGALQKVLEPLLPEATLEQQLGDLSVQSPGTNEKKKKDVGKWFRVCFSQISKAADSFGSGLESNAKN